MSETQGRRGPQEPPVEPARGVRGLAGRLLRMHLDKSAARIVLVGLAFGVIYLVIALRLVAIGFSGEERGSAHHASDVVASNPRPDILDRNGEILATDLQAVSVFAEPNKLVDKDEAVELITSVLPDLDAKALREKLLEAQGLRLGEARDHAKHSARDLSSRPAGRRLPRENRRIYPNGVAAAHILGAVNIDNIGIAGIEKYIDAHGLDGPAEAGLADDRRDLKPVQLSIDLRAQHALRDELERGIEHYQGEGRRRRRSSMSTPARSSPWSPCRISTRTIRPTRSSPNSINRMKVGVFEMGSTFKALTMAMALDSGKFTLNSSFDTRSSLRYGRFTIHDYHGTNRVLTVPEVFTAFVEHRLGQDGADRRRRRPQGLPEEDRPARPHAHRAPESAAPISRNVGAS